MRLRRMLGFALLLAAILGGCTSRPDGAPATAADEPPGAAPPAHEHFAETVPARASAPFAPRGFSPACATGASAPDGVCALWLGDASRINVEPSLAVDPRDARRVLVSWTIREPVALAGQAVTSGASIVAALTSDGGASWRVAPMRDPSIQDTPGGQRYAFDTRAAFAPDGTALVLYGGEMERTAQAVDGVSRITLASSTDGASWSYHRVAELPGAQFDYFGFAVAPDTGHLFVATDEIATGGVWLWTSADHGATWKGPSPVHPSTAGPGGAHFHPALVAGRDGLVVIATQSASDLDPIGVGGPETDASGHVGQSALVSHDDGASFARPSLIVGSFTALVTPSLAVETRGDETILHALLADEKGMLSDARSADDGQTWQTPAPLGSAGGAPYWGMIAVDARGDVHTLTRADSGQQWSASWGCRFPDGATLFLPLASAPRPPYQGPRGHAGDDYGGLAAAPDGSLWAAFGDPREASGARIAIVHLVPA